MSLEGIKRGFEDLWKDVQNFPKDISSKWKSIPDKGKTKIALIAGAVAVVASIVFALALSPAGLAPLGAVLGLGLGLGVGLYMVKHYKGENLGEKLEYNGNRVTQTASDIWESVKNKVS